MSIEQIEANAAQSVLRRCFGWLGRASLAICFPSFYIAVFLSLAALVVLVAWILVDASFDYALELAGIDLGVYEDPGVGVVDAHRWDSLGSRLLFFALVCAIGSLGTAIALLRLLVGQGRGRSLKGLLVATALIGAWLAFFVNFRRLEQQALLYQMRREMPQFEAAAAQLTDHWTDGAEIPGVGAFGPPGDDFPDLNSITTNASEYPLRKSIQGLVSRQSDGTITFDYMYMGGSPAGQTISIQFRPGGNVPNDWQEKHPTLGIKHNKVERTVKLNDHWYIVWYSCPDIEELFSRMSGQGTAPPPTNAAAPDQ